MKLAVVAGGWHWPLHFYAHLPRALPGADLFVISHRSPELPIVREEKQSVLAMAPGPLGECDRELYRFFPTIHELDSRGWKYEEAPNSVGDLAFLNQWLEHNDYRQYDAVLSCHDDAFIRRADLLEQFDGDWLVLTHSRYPEAPDCYLRGSFECFKSEMLDMLGGRIDLGYVGLTREGKIDSPAALEALSEWNNTAVPLRRFMADRKLGNRIKYLSPYYRISPWLIECERGFLHYHGGVPWSFEAGLKAFPLEAAA